MGSTSSLAPAAWSPPSHSPAPRQGPQRVERDTPGRTEPGRCEVTAPAPEHVAADCTAPAPGWAIFTDGWARGWSARVDGRPAPLLSANLAQRAVPLPAGSHRVELTYRPPGFLAGVVVSGLGWLSLLAWAVLAWRRRYAG